jgi:2-methylaconitate cis-trans-isomerase PrpF
MLAAVGPYAIEAGLIAATPDETLVRIFNVNTRKIIEARIQTPDGRITYDGDTHIDGVPGHAAPIFLSFIDAAGAVTGKLLPTGAATDIVDGIEVTCVDCAIPMVLFRATDFGLTGHEAAQTLTENTRLTEQLDALRIECGNRMGISSPEKMVIPKPVLIAPAQRDGTLAVRYFMPHDCHPALATTGAVGIAIATVTPGTIAATISGISSTTTRIKLEHPSGAIEVGLDWRKGPDQPVAGVIRTARRLFEGSVLTKRELPLKKSA